MGDTKGSGPAQFAQKLIASIINPQLLQLKLAQITSSPSSTTHVPPVPDSDNNDGDGESTCSTSGFVSTATITPSQSPPLLNSLATRMSMSMSVPRILNGSEEEDEVYATDEEEGSSTSSSNTNSNNSVYHDCSLKVEDQEPRLFIRSSSLRIPNNSSGSKNNGCNNGDIITSTEKKIVRFADCLGLDLADVKVFLQGEVPEVPEKAYMDLNPADRYTEDEDGKSGSGSGSGGSVSHQHQQPRPLPPPLLNLNPIFPFPSTSLPPQLFHAKVQHQKVLLESCNYDTKTECLTGLVRVLNLEYHKALYVRWTVDGWISWGEEMASYVPIITPSSSSNNDTDRFTFTIKLKSLVSPGTRLVFALRYHTLGQMFWDNNDGDNYVFECKVEGIHGEMTSFGSPLRYDQFAVGSPGFGWGAGAWYF